MEIRIVKPMIGLFNILFIVTRIAWKLKMIC
jgi:hypothetical protein